MRSETRVDTQLFGELVRSFLKNGIIVRFQARGKSMYPAIRDGETVEVSPAASAKVGDVVLAETSDGLRVHRVSRNGDAITTRGDCCFEHDYDARAIGGVAVVESRVVHPVSRRAAGTIIRRWLARWRGRF